jgi:hypothetical protein
MHLALRRCQALAWQRPRRPARARAASPPSAAASPPPPPPPGAPLKAPRPARPAALPPLESPTSLLLALQRSERFSRDAELLGALGGLDDGLENAPGPLLALGARLWIEGLREGRGARRGAVAEALARLAAHGGPRLFGGVCRGAQVPRATVGAALEVLEDLALFGGEEGEAGLGWWWSGGGSGDDEEEDGDDGGAPAPPAGSLQRRRRRRPFTRALHQACCVEVDELMMTRFDDEDDVDASEV